MSLRTCKEIKECPRESNKGIESIIIQIALQIAQSQAKYVVVLILVDMTFCMYIVLIESS
jgi:hypothetical protein